MSLARLFSTILVMVALTFGLTAAATAPSMAASKSMPAAVKKHKAMGKKVYAQHAKTRKTHKKRVLKKNSCLQAYALAQAKRQATKNRMYHQNLRPVLVKCKMRGVAENVAFGFTSASSVQKAWLNSPGHRRNMLNNSYNRIGVGVYKAKNGTLYYAVLFGRAR